MVQFALVLVSLFSTTLFADVLRPIGEEKLGFLVVHGPDGSAANKTVFPYNLTFDKALRDLEKPIRLKAGSYCAYLASEATSQPQELCGIVVAPGKTTEVTLSTLTVEWDSRPGNITRVDLGPKAALTVWRNKQNLMAGTSAAWAGKPGRKLVVFAGDYAFHWGLEFAPISLTIAAGTDHTLDVTPPDHRATIAFKFPKREFPTPPVPSVRGQLAEVNHANETAVVERAIEDSKVPVHDPYEPVSKMLSSALADETRRELKVFPVARTKIDPEHHYSLVLNNVPVVIAPKKGETLQIDIRRIDVDDVQITREDGSAFTVEGTFVVERKDMAAGKWSRVIPSYRYSTLSGVHNVAGFIQSFPTRTGIDVPAGFYRVLLTYETAEGEQKQTHELDLR